MESEPKNIGRRVVFRGLAAAAAIAVGASAPKVGALDKPKQKGAKPCCEDQQLPDKSVFNTICDSKSADKYKKGDNPVVYRLGALWLMLVTEDWTDYFDQAKEADFLKGLASELKLNLKDVTKLWNISKTKKASFDDVRASWMNLTSNAGLYGARPCHGGKSILTIACLDPNDEREKELTELK